MKMSFVSCLKKASSSPVLSCLIRQISQGTHKSCVLSSGMEIYRIRKGSAFTRQIFTLNKTLHFRPQYSKDGVPKTYTLVYENSQGPLLSISRILSTLGGISGAGMALWYLLDGWEQLESWQLYALGGSFLFCAAAVVSVNVIARFYLVRIYLNEIEGRFIGIHQSFVGRLGRIEYRLEDVQPPVRDKAKPIHSKTTVRVKDRSFHIRAADFILPKFYNAHLKLS